MTLTRPLLVFSFRLHDWAAAWLARYFFRVKTVLLIIAHLTLFGFFFPDLRKEFGEMAGNLLIGILFLSPLSKIFRARLLQQLMGLRREFGITFGYLATVHGVGYLTDPLIAPYFIEQVTSSTLGIWERPFLFGFLAYAVTLPLLFTSNTLANRLLGGRNWKLLHRTVYVMALLAVMHRFTIKGMDPVALIEMVVLIGGYLLVKLLAWKNFLPPLVSLIDWVAEEYRLFKTPVEPPAAPSVLPQF